MQTLLQDLRYGARMLLKRPGFTLIAVLTLALGIGANATIFSWTKSVLLRPAPGVANYEELVAVTGATTARRGLGVSYLDYSDFRERNAAFSGLLAYTVSSLNLGYDSRAEVLLGGVVSGNYFEVLGVKAQLGRTFLPEEDQTPNTHPVAVISHDGWQQRFAGQPTIVGQINVGFNPDNVLLASLDLTMNNYDEARVKNFYRELPARIAALPGVTAVTLARRPPLRFGGASSSGIEVEGYTPAPGEELRVGYDTVGPDYFRTLQIPMLGGRDFTERDDERVARVVVVNDTLAARYWPGQNAIGKRLRFGNQWHEIVGLARTINHGQVNEAAQPFLFLPLRQNYQPAMTLVTRVIECCIDKFTHRQERMLQNPRENGLFRVRQGEPINATLYNGDAAASFAAIQNTLAQLDPNLPTYDVQTMVEVVGVSLFLQRMAATLLSLFGSLALTLAAIGLYGVMAFTVSQRTREIGIRMALGARGADVMKLIVGQGMRVALLGLFIGLSGAWGLTRLLKTVLIGVSASDPLSFVGAALLMGLVALIACWIPARRATRVDPMIALRCE
jgi:predicted permease